MKIFESSITHKMKNQVIIKCLLLISLTSTFGQNTGELYLKGNTLKGKCENKYFTGFEIELDSTYTKIDSITLFDQLPRIGSINFKNKFDLPTEFTLTERAGFKQIMFRFKNTYLTFDNLQMESQFISFTVNNDPQVPVTEEDLKIIQVAKKLLSEEKYWNKEDDRKCDDDLANKSYSLYCALRLSSLEIENRYNHRNAVLQKLRHLIETKHPDKKWRHRLMDFNNMEETKYDDIINILNEIEQDFLLEINIKNKE